MIEPVLENVDRPEGQGAHYRFFRDVETGRVFKAKHESRTAPNGDPALTISVAPVDEDGKALRDPLDQPDVYWHTHTFTATELGADDFDLNARVASIIVEAVGRKQVQLGTRGKLKKLGDAWGDDAPIPLDPVPVIHKA